MLISQSGPTTICPIQLQLSDLPSSSLPSPEPAPKLIEIMARGAFIVIEGLDRSGKTTQTELLTERLTTKNGVSIERRKFPGE